MKFTKMHGIGNDFVMVNGFSEPFDPASAQQLAVKLCDRKFGVGSDGLIAALPGRSEQFAMRMWNPDGSESEMCGNGIRCFANFLRDEGLTQESEIPVETGAGRLVVEVLAGNQVKVDMGRAKLTRGEIGMTGPEEDQFVDQELEGTSFRGTAVSMGNPHVVVFVTDLDAVDLAAIGPQLEHHSLFPKRVNVHFVQVLSNTHVKMKTWERGAGATLACGTGACSVAVASFLNGHTGRAVKASLPGGDLSLDYQEDGRVFMTGPSETVFVGEFAA